MAKGCKFLCTRSRLLESVIVTEFQAKETYCSLDLTKAKNTSRLSKVEKDNVSVRIKPNSFIDSEKRKSTY
jgi:hypothetical protein